MPSTVYEDSYITITRQGDLFLIKSFGPGMDMEQFNSLLVSACPFIRVTSYPSVKKVLHAETEQPEVFGVIKERFALRLEKDNSAAYLIPYAAPEELEPANRLELVKEILSVLGKAGIVHGILTGCLRESLTFGEEITIAKATPAVNGEDSVVKMYSLAQSQPQIVASGKVDHYELNLINRVNEGDWLGERTDPTPGVPGTDIRGFPIKPVPGRLFPLKYDRTSVREAVSPGLTVLYSKKSGAVYFQGATIGVYDLLEIKGNVDYSTGNVDFNGFLTIRGTVEDKFSITATRDIEILGEIGVGAVKQIVSTEGSVYIKGGVAGKGAALIHCKKNLFVKYLSDTTVECEGSVYTGFYCFNSRIRAKQLIVESSTGRLTGGFADLDIRASAHDIGSRTENRTVIRIRGFDREAFLAEMEDISHRLKDLRLLLPTLKKRYSSSNAGGSTPDKGPDLVMSQIAKVQENIKVLEFRHKSLEEFLKTPGEGAVLALSHCYPRVRVEIKDRIYEVLEPLPMTSFVYRNFELEVL